MKALPDGRRRTRSVQKERVMGVATRGARRQTCDRPRKKVSSLSSTSPDPLTLSARSVQRGSAQLTFRSNWLRFAHDQLSFRSAQFSSVSAQLSSAQFPLNSAQLSLRSVQLSSVSAQLSSASAQISSVSLIHAQIVHCYSLQIRYA